MEDPLQIVFSFAAYALCQSDSLTGTRKEKRCMEEVMREEGRETPPAPKKKRGPRLGKKKKWLVLVLVLAVAAIAAVKLLGGR